MKGSAVWSVCLMTSIMAGCSDNTLEPVAEKPTPNIQFLGLYKLYAVNDSLIHIQLASGGSETRSIVFATKPCELYGEAGIDSLSFGPNGEIEADASMNVRHFSVQQERCYSLQDGRLLWSQTWTGTDDGTIRHVRPDSIAFTGLILPGARLSGVPTATQLDALWPDSRAVGGRIKLTYRP